MRSFLRIALATIVALIAIDECAVAQASRPALEEGIVTAQIHQVIRRDIVCYFAADTLFVPYRAMAEFLGIIHAISADGDTVRGELPTGSPFVYLVDDGTFVRNGEIDTLAEGALRAVDGDLLVRVDELSRTLRLGASFDAERLTLTIPPDRSIPTVDLRAAMRRYARLGDAEEMLGTAEHDAVVLSRSLLGPIGLDWGLSNMTMGETTASYGTMTVSTPFLFGVLGLRGRAGLADDPSRVDLGFEGATWRLDLPELPMLQTIALGFRPSATSPSYSIGLNGSTLTGAPQSYGMREIEGDAEPGWWAELYEGPRLIDAVRVGDDGHYRFDVPMTASVTARRIGLRGPHGEREWETHTFAVGADMLPPGDLRWNLGGSTYRYLEQQAMSASAGLTVGVFDRLTLSMSAQLPGTYVSRLSVDSVSTSIGMRLALFDATPVSLSIDPRSLRFGMAFGLEPIGGVPLRVRLDSVDVRQRTFDLALSSSVALGPVSLSAIGRYVNRWDRRGYEFSPKISTRLLGVNLSTSLRASRIERFGGRSELDERSADRRMLLRAQASFSPLRRVRFRLGGSFDALTSRIVETNAGLSFPLFSVLNLGVAYAMPGTDWRNGSFSANVGLNLPFARGSVSTRYDNGRVTTQSRLGGSLVLSPLGVDVVSEHVTSRAQLFVYGYHDRNLNGEYDGDDVMLGPIETSVRVGDARIGTGVSFETLPARRTMIVEVDPEQLADRALYPLRARQELALSAGTTEQLYVPFASGSELYGTARIDLPSGRAGQVAALLGLRVRLESLSGVAVYEGEFINDGSYMLSGVAPGEYRFVFDEALLAMMGLALGAPPETVTVAPGAETLPEIVFVPLDNDSTPSDADDGD